MKIGLIPKKFKDWILLEPDITNIDLRPYYYACKEKIDYFAGRAESVIFRKLLIFAKIRDGYCSTYKKK